VKRLAQVLAVALGVVAAQVGAIGSKDVHANAVGPRTQVVVVSPVSNTGILSKGYRIATTVRGTCELGSPIASGTLYQCHSDTRGYALCWALASEDHRIAVCTDDILGPSLVEVRTTQLLQRSHGTIILNLPLMVRLTSGLICSMTPGSPDQFRGHFVRYYCHGSAMELLDSPDIKPPLWTIRTVISSSDQSGYRNGPVVQIKTAWYAGP
jgi:hypothetical protein